MYDVFLSHNRLENRWVRSLCDFLSANGLNVFFDADESLPSAGNVAKAVEQALCKSRHVVLVLSQSSLSNRWPAMEMQLTVHEDTEARNGTIVPVLIEHVGIKTVQPSVKTLDCIDLTGDQTREQQLRLLLHRIGVQDVPGITRNQLEGLLSLNHEHESSSLMVAGIKEVLDWGWDGIRLLDELIRLDYETVKDLVPAHEGYSRQWAPIFVNYPDTWRMLIGGPRRIVGYWHFVPLSSEDYKAAKEGTLLDSEITADRVQFHEPSGWYNIYFAQICMLRQYRTPRNVYLLLETIFRVLNDFAAKGMFAREICVNAYTDVGRALCRIFGLHYVREHNEHGSIHVGSVYDVLDSSFGSTPTFADLRERYEKKITVMQLRR